MATCDWLDLYLTAYAQILPWHCSDHRALILDTRTNKWKRKKLFKYDRRWRFEPEFKERVQRIWADQCQDVPSHQFSKALTQCRKGLSLWPSQNVTNTQQRIKQLNKHLQDAYQMPSIDYHLIGELKSQLNYAYRLEEKY